jgi:hypothetical protein
MIVLDEYESFLEILDELNYRELRALAILDSFSESPRTAEQTEIEWTKTFWDDFANRLTIELGVPQDAGKDFMNRISRTGCFELYAGSYIGDTGAKGKLTATYKRLKRFVGQSAE